MKIAAGQCCWFFTLSAKIKKRGDWEMGPGFGGKRAW
jgi:hypothetical protein